MVHSLGYNDGVLLVSLLYSCADIHLEWEAFDTCARPVHHWLLVSYACVLGFRLVHVLGSRSKEAGSSSAASSAAGEADRNFLLELRHEEATRRALSWFTWILAFPFFAFWTLLGTSWLWSTRARTPECMPTEGHFWFAALWLALCYVWLAIYGALGAVAAAMEWRVRCAEGDLRQVEDADVLSRWGQVSRLASYRELPGVAGQGQGAGLAPSEIAKLLGEATLAADEEAEAADGLLECPICISPLEAGDRVRRLRGCGHTFHKPCIDLWMLRSAECPLCKRSVREGGGGAAGCGG